MFHIYFTSFGHVRLLSGIFVMVKLLRHTKKTKLRGFSPQANYTDRAIAACRQRLVPTLADRGCRVISATNSQIQKAGWALPKPFLYLQYFFPQ
jgi:hypothetical protein